jgi:hypothetical protein
MTVQTTTTSVSYTGDGSTTSFPVTFPFLGTGATSEIAVIQRTISTGAEVTLTYTTDYTATGGSGDTGTVIAGTAPASTVELHIRRSTTETQLTDYVENDAFPAETHELALDRLTMIAQAHTSDISQKAGFPVTYTGGASPALPEPTANKALKWNSGGTALENSTNDVDTAIDAAAASAAAAAVSESAAAASAAAAAASETAAGVSATNAAASETAALAAAQGWAAVTSVTAATTNIEITDGRTYYLLDATSNTVDINLPAISTDEGVTYAFEVVNVDNAITIVRDGTDYINGANGDYSGLTAVGDVIYFTSDDSTPDNWIATLVTRVNADESTLTLTGRTMSILDNGVTPAKVSGSVNAQTGTTYTLVLGDAFKTVTMSNASANTLTIPPNSSVAFAVGDRIDIVMLAAGVTSVVGGSGVTVNGVSTGTGAIAAQYGAVSCLKIATDTWLLMGNHGGVA